MYRISANRANRKRRIKPRKSAPVLGVANAIRWHMVGRIQRNKARSIAGWAHAAHSVDSAKVIAALDRAASRALADGRRREPLRVYIQISLDGDIQRGGVDIDRPDLVDESVPPPRPPRAWSSSD